VQEQPALAASLGSEHRRIAPHLRPARGEQPAVPQSHRQRGRSRSHLNSSSAHESVSLPRSPFYAPLDRDR
jgi:hypothetical protein